MKYGQKVRVLSGFYEGIGFIVEDKDNNGRYLVKKRAIYGLSIIHEEEVLVEESNLEIIN